ncbi:Uncharacterized conserved protein (DUF2362) [Nesidiocoris tenuis]|uniref:Uncharacterized conserved protein (DUF2362) n=1 Tax=Nesidiocoris tenuis TaxID=355587 RepID=A0ABN7AF12_9HEMI|nr:Uncharacterized conserved protein (DUF2362) [Nesidiocoris tenuis]
MAERITISGSVNVEDLINRWERVYNVPSHPPVWNAVQDNIEQYAAAYHKLVHSPVLDTILHTEHSFATVIHRLVKERDEEIGSLASKQTEEMSKALEGLSLGLTEADITAIAKKHQEEHGMEIASWESQLQALRESQKDEYRNWLMSLLEQSYESPLATPLSSPVVDIKEIPDETYSNLNQNLQESFTIHLGSQMKQMYNIRILSAEVLDFCQVPTNDDGELERQPRRMQTALGLYSNDLSGIVLLSDNHLGGFSGITQDFVRVCEMSTELHFPSVDDQLEKIRGFVKDGIEWRKINAICDNHLLSYSEQQSRKSGTKYLQVGDVYITKHSNLSDVHVVFHMVADDSLKSGEITSRHAAILGLRNIMKCACSNDVTTLTIPLLLSHEMTPEMTMTWCNRRAELVYKCVKGFMIEMASWGGSELKNLQFLVPTGIHEDIFSALVAMVPSIFRVSNPLVLKANSS